MKNAFLWLVSLVIAVTGLGLFFLAVAIFKWLVIVAFIAGVVVFMATVEVRGWIEGKINKPPRW